MHIIRHAVLTIGLCAAVSMPVMAQDQAARSRGELLYSTFCVGCHTTQAHWRDKRIATNLTLLRAQVRRWQGNAGQQWSDADIEEVVNHLNGLYYKFPRTTDKS